jgi:hypothetical protein
MSQAQDILPGFEGEQRREDISQFYTRPDVAERIAEWALRWHPRVESILDPAAGQGALLRPFVGRGIELHAWDLDPRNVEVLRTIPGVHASLVDLRSPPELQVDLVVENPPYHDGLDVDGVMVGLRCAPFVVALLRSVAVHGLDRWERLWRRTLTLREARFVERPTFGGRFTPKQDFIVVEVGAIGGLPLERGEAAPPHPVEWW